MNKVCQTLKINKNNDFYIAKTIDTKRLEMYIRVPLTVKKKAYIKFVAMSETKHV